MAQAYVDDNETIYLLDSIESTGLSGGNQTSLLTSLATAPLDTLMPGQSTVFVNRLTFKLSAWLDPDGTDFNETYFECCAGIVPSGQYVASNAPAQLSDYQTIKGWPLKGCYGNTSWLLSRDNDMASSAWQRYGSNVSWQKTFKPRNSLLISRMQEINFTVRNKKSNGSDCKVLLTLEAQLKRGD